MRRGSAKVSDDADPRSHDRPCIKFEIFFLEVVGHLVSGVFAAVRVV